MSGGKVSQPITTVRGLLLLLPDEASVTPSLSKFLGGFTSRFYRVWHKKGGLYEVFAL